MNGVPGAWKEEERIGTRHQVVAVRCAKRLRDKTIVVIEGRCSKLRSRRVVLVEKIVHLHEELNALSDLVPRSNVADTVSSRFSRPVIVNAIRLIQIVFIATREG